VSDEDPFEELDEAVEDREGDPFDGLGFPEDAADDERPSPVDADSGATAEDEGEPHPDGDDGRSPWGEPLEPDAPDSAATSRSGENTGAAGRTGPPGSEGASSSDEGGDATIDQEPGIDASTAETEIGESTAEIRDEPSIDPGGSREGDPFESMGDAFTEMDVEGVDPDDIWQRLTSAESRGSVTQEAERTYAEVSKHSYCEQCEHFSEPPAIDCSHEGTEIVEFLDMDRVRVVDCPIVAERKDLEDE